MKKAVRFVWELYLPLLGLVAILAPLFGAVVKIGGSEPTKAVASGIEEVMPDTIEFIRNAHPAGRIEYDFHTLRLVSNPNEFDQAGLELQAEPVGYPERRAELFLYGTADPNLIFFAGGSVAIASSAGQFAAVNYGLNYGNATLTYKNAAGDLVTAGHPQADNEWQAATLASGWGNYGNGYSTAGYRLAPDGAVWLKGTIAPTQKYAPTHIFVLPTLYRPAEVLSFPLDGGRVEVRPNGEVSVIGASWVTFDSVRFWPQGE